MNISRRWLEAFLHRDLDARDVADRLTMLGAPVDAVDPLHADLGDLVVALVEAVVPHPNADRLHVCTVNDGGPERRTVVCGAPNVTAGHRYPFARVGTTMPGGFRIEKRKLRGEVSEGMLCSGREIGLSEDHDGLYTLEIEDAPGTPLLEALPLADDRLEVDVTPNRPDLLGHKGIARELAASYGIPFRLPIIPGSRLAEVPNAVRATGGEGRTGGLTVRIDDRDGCRRFLGAVIRGVTIGPSPAWLSRRLHAVGLRSVNNVVDATNYVLQELGQPMHAYDLARLRGGVIVARAALANEPLRTLDGTDRVVRAGMTVIADGERVVGVAGVMGGEETEVTGGTTDVFLECAWFAPSRVRATRTVLSLSTDASHRFERGVDLGGAADSFRRALELILTVAGGQIDGSPVDVWPTPEHPPRIFLRLKRLYQVLGVELPLRAVESALVAIGATVVAKPEDERLAVDVPGWRPDLVEEIDLVEEVARIHGYDSIPSDLQPFRLGLLVDAPAWSAVDRVRQGLVRLGLLETVTLPLGQYADGVLLANPLTAEHRRLRPALIPGLTRQVTGNWDAGTRDIRLFEIGTVFRDAATGEPPWETIRVAATLTGRREPAHWTASGKAPDLDRWDLRGVFEAVVGLAYPGASVQVEGDSWVARSAESAVLGQATISSVEGPPWAGPLLALEVDVATGIQRPPVFQSWATTPASDRDLALLVPEGVMATQALDSIRGAGVTILESVQVLDEFRGPELPAGCRSVAFRLRFRAPDRTLRDTDVDRAVEDILSALESTLGVTLRTG